MLRLLIRLYESVPKPDWVSIAQCLMFLDDPPEVAKILNKLLTGSEVCIIRRCCWAGYLADLTSHGSARSGP